MLWECNGPLPGGGLPASLNTTCMDLFTNLVRYCCPQDFDATCPTG